MDRIDKAVASPHWEACQSCRYLGDNGCMFEEDNFSTHLGDWIICNDWESNLKDADKEGKVINDELKLFLKDITLFLQKHSNYNSEKIEPMFQRAYRLYVKYNVEKKQSDSATNLLKR